MWLLRTWGISRRAAKTALLSFNGVAYLSPSPAVFSMPIGVTASSLPSQDQLFSQRQLFTDSCAAAPQAIRRLFGKIHSLKKLAIARVGTDAVEQRVNFQTNHPEAVLIDCLVEPREGATTISQAEIAETQGIRSA